MQHSLRSLAPWQLEIIRKYPSLYLDPNPEVVGFYERHGYELDREQFCNLRFGFECDKGWAGLIDEFSAVAVAQVEKLRTSGLQPDARISACIFKEKFGTLQWQGSDNLVEPFKTLFRTYCTSIENRSSSVCERTGARARPRCINGWHVTLSDEEYRKELERRAAHES